MSGTGQFFIPGAQPPPVPPVRRTESVAAPAVPHTPVPAPVEPQRVAAVERPRTTGVGDVETVLDDLLRWIVRLDASDLHLASGATPKARLHGKLTPIDGIPAIGPSRLEAMLMAIMNDRQRKAFAEHNDVDLAYALGNTARFRVNVFRQKGRVGSVMRLIPSRVKTVEELDIPDPLRALAQLPRGLVLVTGPTGSGKSTMLAALIDLANRTRAAHIVTIEDPIEFTHTSQMCVVTQRQIGEDTDSFPSALRAALRQDPDIILLGEMRDLDTTQAALEAAETGHLVFATMHTKSAPETISRVVNMFPGNIQNQIQATLASCLEAVVTQTLVPTPDGNGRVAAREVMMLAPDSRNLIRKGKLEQMDSVLQTGAERGMYTLNTDLARLVKTNQVAYEDAAAVASDIGELNRRLNMAAPTTGRTQ